jgi:long-chain acyl-CoA synthetase
MKLGDLLADNAWRNPDDLALVCADRRLTQSELDRRANRIANAILARGIQLGDRVALFMPNSVELGESMAGVVKSGALLVPVSTRLTADEVAYILGHCEPGLIVYPESHREVAVAALRSRPEIIRICVGQAQAGETAFEDFVASGAETPPPQLPPEQVDCVIGYTSGTTGRPKGAVGTHMNFVMAGVQSAQEFGLGPGDGIFAASPMAHRTGLARMANMFQFGCSLIMQPRFDVADAVDVIEREGATILGGVPTIVRMMMPEIEKRPADCASLRLVMATGELFEPALRQRLFAALPHVGLYSFLGQTEGGVMASVRPEQQAWKPLAMGRPLPGIEVRLVDREMQEVAKGEPGEILARCGLPGQVTIMREYYRDPAATEATFHEGWLRTGDVGWEDEDGFLYFADRVKDMIVSGGLNIYSKEVEQALMEHEAVEDAAVFGIPDEEFGEQVAAVVALEPGATASAEGLIEHCRARIASYKKPKRIRFVEQLPRTSSGKVLKYELKEMFS